MLMLVIVVVDEYHDFISTESYSDTEFYFVSFGYSERRSISYVRSSLRWSPCSVIRVGSQLTPL